MVCYHRIPIRILALLGIFSILTYQNVSHSFWIIKKSVWPCFLSELITTIFPFKLPFLKALECEWITLVKAAIFIVFPLNHLCFTSQNICILFILSTQYYISQMLLPVYSPSSRQRLREQPTSATAFGWILLPNQHHLCLISLYTRFWTHTADGTIHFSQSSSNHYPHVLATCFQQWPPKGQPSQSSIILQTLILSRFLRP